MEHKLAMVILWMGRRTKLRQWPIWYVATFGRFFGFQCRDWRRGGHNILMVGPPGAGGIVSGTDQDEQWERLQTYLSHVEGGEQRLQIYRKVQETGQVPVCIDAEQWVSQWNEDLQQAGI